MPNDPRSLSTLFAELPSPRPNHLTLYTLGPGFGESQVVSLPDGRWLVVDSCIHQGRNLPLELLRYHGVSALDMLLVTHPDLDHVAGVDTLISELYVRRLWRYPGSATLVDMLPRLLNQRPDDTRLRALRQALASMDMLAEDNRAFDVRVSRPLSPPGAPYEIVSIAPPPADVRHYEQGLEKILVEWTKGGPVLNSRLRSYLMGGKKRLAPKANRLSLALSISWNGRRIILGGDLENPSDPRSGWNGVLGILEEDRCAHILCDAAVVKASHHGSTGAFHEEMWRMHAGSRGIEVALVTPFSKGRNSPPHIKVIKQLTQYTKHLAVTAKARYRLPSQRSGWRARSAAPSCRVTAAQAPCVAVVMGPQNSLEVFLGGGACCLTQA